MLQIDCASGTVMLKRLVKAIAYRTDPGRWSHTVEDYYPVTPRSRWRDGQMPKAHLQRALDRSRDAYSTFLDAAEAHSDLLHGVPQAADPAKPNAPHWDNTWFTALDAAALMTFVAWKKPKRYIEIGSGNSTTFCRHAITQSGLATHVTSIDPMPREKIDRICDRIIRTPLEECDLTIFDALEAGDILFFDGSHRAFSNSDVVVFFFEVMPRLKPGVIVQIHDIFIPNDYPDQWSGRLYNEQYVLAAMLMCGDPPFRVIAPIAFICHDPVLSERVKRLFAARSGGRDIPFVYPINARKPGVSFWIETKAMA